MKMRTENYNPAMLKAAASVFLFGAISRLG
jgi:hypothetical protein